MCQIIALKTTKKKFKQIRNNPGILDSLEDLLREKGGDYYSAAIIVGDERFITYSNAFDEAIDDLTDFIKKKVDDKNPSMQILLFSRQQPEMEASIVREQPYKQVVEPQMIFAVHGTIHNDKKLSEEYNAEIGADTEILRYMPIEDWHKADGAFVAIGIDSGGLPLIYEHGLKLWSNKLNCCKNHLADVLSTGNLDFMNPPVIDLSDRMDTPKTLVASFSGGMDIALSTFQALSTGNYHSLVMNYFAWGSKAEESEIEQLEKFRDFYSSQFPEIQVTIELREAEYYFDEYFKINQAPLPKISLNNKESFGEVAETESPIAYVPYRNTQFAILLASIYEAEEIKDIDFLFGLNLSEGMVFMDNSEGWLEAISNTVKLGGKDPKITQSYNVISPYFARTKTNMIKEFKEDHTEIILEQLLVLSRSCYYPDEDGNPCGKCGSCLLRQAAENKNIKGV